MAIQKRSIITSVTTSISAVGLAVESSADVVSTLAGKLPAGVDRVCSSASKLMDIQDLYLDNWVKDKTMSNREEKISRLVRAEELRVLATKANITTANNVQDFLNEVDAMNI